MANAVNPKSVTIYGRLSFPRFTHAEAVAGNKKSQFVEADESKVKPEFNLLIEQAQLDKLKDHLRNVFLPYTEEQYKKDPKSKDALDPTVVKKVLAMIDSEDWGDTPPTMFIKPISEKNKESAPEAVASVKIVGSPGSDITLKATVHSEDQLAVPDPDILTYPLVKNLQETVFQMYAGAYVASTLNLYAFFSSKAVNGISAGANVAIYRGNLEGERFGGGVDIDMDEIFMD